MIRFYRYEGFNEGRQPVVLWIDLSVVVAIHEMTDTVYVEAESVNWTLRRSHVDVEALREAWMGARAGR